jgi:hypothetical protein
MKFTESMLDEYSQPLSSTEDAQCKQAISTVRDALKVLSFTDDGRGITPLYSDTAAYAIEMRSLDHLRKIKLFVQGSYANNTNVRKESDVDIAVIEESIFRTEYRSGITDEDYKINITSRTPNEFKDEVQRALEVKFGNDVERGDKSVKVHGNSYRKDADTVPCLRNRDYRNDYNFDSSNYIGGIAIYPDSGGVLINYPEQHIYNGRQKNKATSGYFKKMVRIMKKMRYLMQDHDYLSANNVSSFMLESMLWNVPDIWYSLYCDMFSRVKVFDELIKVLIKKKHSFMSWKEANGIKPLCPDENAYKWLCRFVEDLSAFYEYE